MSGSEIGIGNKAIVMSDFGSGYFRDLFELVLEAFLLVLDLPLEFPFFCLGFPFPESLFLGPTELPLLLLRGWEFFWDWGWG